MTLIARRGFIGSGALLAGCTMAPPLSRPTGAGAQGFVRREGVRLFTFGVGYDVNTRLLDRVAADNGGVADYVDPREDLEVKVSAFFDKVNHPVLSDVRVDMGDANSELSVHVNRERAAAFGFSADQVAQFISMALRGSSLRDFHREDVEVPVNHLIVQRLIDRSDLLDGLSQAESGGEWAERALGRADEVRRPEPGSRRPVLPKSRDFQ